MRRAALQAFRTARRSPLWKISGKRAYAYFSSNPTVAGRQASFIPASLQSSMHVRNFSLAFISTLVASGAWYAYKGTTEQSTVLNGTSVSSLQSRGIADTTPKTAGADDGESHTRRALLVENDQFYATTLSSDIPLSKETDDSDRRMLGMLTPEQATQKLRKNEESYLVNRGQGVVRYDLVQVPSNSPIEDDHAEKIVEVPHTVAGATDGPANSDWMFWGVFDGHSYVHHSLTLSAHC